MKLVNLTVADYKKLVKAAYNDLRHSGRRPHLNDAKRAAIRDECLSICRGEIDTRDKIILESFFSIAGSREGLLQVVNQSTAEDYKSVQKFMLGQTVDPDHKIVEMLALLVQFRHRPFRTGDTTVELNEAEQKVLGLIENDGKKGKYGPGTEEPSPEPIIEPDPGEGEVNGGKKLWRNPAVKKAGLVAGIVALFSGGLFYAGSQQGNGCMYWADDHYELVPCDDKTYDRILLPANAVDLQLKKITREDTITDYSIGRLYYIKTDKDVEYFNQGGKYPKDINRSLKKLTRRIYDNDSLGRYTQNYETQ